MASRWASPTDCAEGSASQPTRRSPNSTWPRCHAPRPPETVRFVIDGHLGRLAAYLRALGFDTDYSNDGADDELARRSSREQRILLTRDQGLLKRSIVEHGYWVRNIDPEEQLFEVCRRFDLGKRALPFTRCVSCNGVLADVEKEEVEQRLLPGTRQRYDRFRRCSACGQIFWRGSHYDRMSRLIDAVLAAGELGSSGQQR
jgi:uncharacterized protein with PIN domain